MKKSIVLAVICAVVIGFGSVASADEILPGAGIGVDQSVMGVGQTMMQMGASDRAATNRVNNMSRTIMTTSPSVNSNYQFGSSQTDQSWKAARTVEEAQVRGLVPGDCQGDNSDDAYRKQMGQTRDGFMKENLVSNEQCQENHPTLK
ncbi:MAG: hypothetical protein NPINA01_32450 [Nitrospinaceae bacterium]|nr:MAG: hypothetical protein NPINA01_32450 [Nitrospinaceae bacterium]